MTAQQFSTIRIEFVSPLDPDTYAALVHGCWAVLVAAGHARTATIGTDINVLLATNAPAQCRFGR